MRALLAVPVAAAFVAAATPSHAQWAAPDSENGRYVFNTVPDGLLRLDTRTGQVSLCGKRAAGWSCQSVPDERAALEGEIARLQNENGALKKELVTRGIPLPGAMRPDTPVASAAPPPGGSAPGLKLPTDAELDRVMSFVEKVWRRLVDMVQTMQRDAERKS